MENISICGTDCPKCYCFGKMCSGCKGKVFHAGGAECAIYACCVTEHGFFDCLQCGRLPCEIWRKTRDPKFTDEEFEKNITGRIETLRSKNI